MFLYVGRKSAGAPIVKHVSWSLKPRFSAFLKGKQISTVPLAGISKNFLNGQFRAEPQVNPIRDFLIDAANKVLEMLMPSELP